MGYISVSCKVNTSAISIWTIMEIHAKTLGIIYADGLSSSAQWFWAKLSFAEKKTNNFKFQTLKTNNNCTLAGRPRPIRIAARVTCPVDRVTNLVVVVAVALILTVHTPPTKRTFYKRKQPSIKERDLCKNWSGNLQKLLNLSHGILNLLATLLLGTTAKTFWLSAFHSRK